MNLKAFQEHLFSAMGKILKEVREQITAEWKSALQQSNAELQGQIDGLAEVAELACKQIDREAHMSLTVLEKLAFDLEYGPLTATREAPAEHENPLVTAILKEVSQ